MIHKAKPHENILFRSMRKSFRVTAIATSDDEANEHMAKPGNDDAVIACFGPFVIMANKYEGLRDA